MSPRVGLSRYVPTGGMPLNSKEAVRWAAKTITPPARCFGPTAAYRYRSIQKRGQDG